MKPIATDTRDFPSLRRDGNIYVDKTEYVHRMVLDANSRLFFISRPVPVRVPDDQGLQSDYKGPMFCNCSKHCNLFVSCV